MLRFYFHIIFRYIFVNVVTNFLTLNFGVPGVCAAESLLLRTHPDGAFLSIIFVTYAYSMQKGLCASNDRKNALVMVCSRYADFYRADS